MLLLWDLSADFIGGNRETVALQHLSHHSVFKPFVTELTAIAGTASGACDRYAFTPDALDLVHGRWRSRASSKPTCPRGRRQRGRS
jgi:hypothetical protein